MGYGEISVCNLAENVAPDAVTASAVVVVVGQGGGHEADGAKIAPVKALKPSELTKIPPGTPVADLTLPVEYGRFRIVPQGSVPSRAGSYSPE